MREELKKALDDVNNKNTDTVVEITKEEIETLPNNIIALPLGIGREPGHYVIRLLCK